MDRLNTLSWCFLCCLIGAHGLPSKLLYDYANLGTNLTRGNDVSSPEVKLKVPIVFYGRTYTSIFVNSNGLLSFDTEIPSFFNIEFPLDYPVIAPLYSNVDISRIGTVSYYETDNPHLLTRITNNIHQAFSYMDDFQATSLFIATWSGVGYHKNGVDKLNSFQVVVASNGDDSFVEFLYPENGIQWIQGTGDESGLPDARAQAGFVASDLRLYVIPGSGTDQIKNLELWSNMNLPGEWLFRVGRLDNDVPVEEPDLFNEPAESGLPKSCSKGAALCHGFAKCTDYNDGFCCSCRSHYYGNGKYCIKKDAPLRVNGKVNGKLSGEKLQNLDLQSYIVMADGRAYTAISKIPESISFDIQALQVIGGVIGWVFAKPISDAVNGFHLTGGIFNHTATIVFPNTNQKVVIRHKYFGLDVFDQLKLEVDVQGDIPHLPVDAKVTILEYEEQYTLTAPGTIQATSSRVFTYTNIDGSETPVPFTVDQSFIFDYCKFETVPTGVTWRLKVGKNFISYEAREQIVRFGLTNKIGPLGDTDPCNVGRSKCGPNSACVVENDIYKCVCNPGYQFIHKDGGNVVCEDVNECQTGLHDCDFNAQCVNEIGSYSCRCNPGFEGNGQVCQNAQTCKGVQCPENSECVERGLAMCQCIVGFTGNGQVCTPIASQSCHIANNCSPYGYCTINPQTNMYSCYCQPGYVGDGYRCEKEILTTTPSIVTTTIEELLKQQCAFNVCWCPIGYKKQDGTVYCIPVVEPTTLRIEVTTIEAETETAPPAVSCNVINDCHRNAQCIYDLGSGRHQCVCNVGFEGDGHTCRESAASCTIPDECDIHASCIYYEHINSSVCICDAGYQGNGKECYIVGCTSNKDCLPNEQCLYTNASVGYECVCKEGLVRDSQQQCVQVSGTCGTGICAENAECLYDQEYQTYYCSCKPDFIGDGITECKPRPVGCNVINNCSPYATCQYDQQQAAYQCKCNNGYYGDGLVCYVEKDCRIDPYLCDSRAVCVVNANHKYVCECQRGYVGNGTICRETPKHDGNYLLLNQGKATLRIPFDPSQRKGIKLTHINEFQTAVGLDIDCYTGRVYWSDISGRTIKSSNYNGSDVMNFITTDIGSPEGLSIDWISRNIYWTDSTKDTIEVANLETKLRAVLFNTSLVNPRGIAVHPQRGKIFWADWNRAGPKVEWANADGTGRENFLEGHTVQLPNSVAIDFDTERLCYTDAGTKSIECVDIDTRYRQTIATNCTYPFGIAITDEHIYWTDWVVKKIERVDKRTRQRLEPLDVPLAGTNKLYSIVAVPERCLGLSNICQYYKNQCPGGHICVPNGTGNRRCLCGYKVDSPNEKPICAP